MTVALWYCPLQGSLEYEILSQLIASLQSLFPGSPAFEPHITLNTRLECRTEDNANQVLTSCVAAIHSVKSQLKLKPGQDPLVSFKSCYVGKRYFKKVALECRKNKILMSIHQIINELYVPNPNPTTAFDPHLSLLYSDVTPISKAFLRIVLQRIEDILDVNLEEDPATANTNLDDIQVKWNFDTSPTNIAWNVPGSFKIVRCEGPVDEWEVLGQTTI
ncbi:2',3'-cyclic-nucleotide 3'-phosphodiesterase KNAG_0K00500 [Huiozyma naganishii CBS 8797]|uniref:2',3'-cyclic-nucleotide 3'-phosphodiesterase n=1 Tax=Huiozyma naganishii (strain ATCC MYA-139 / BCRC 22969 / CBS 8797 / KCTC 17520 / NBRC 10181 / NCYC 3082 / Yp74L-3) TaxID=1071383 RepID=J7RRD1_HUIN7|nr:hypothetical protein KNAG_0K00500 [Kazachstania naganishii CBS 8797]CCK72418.1 hypothetical protein KNAG_0K00500 [Kazachstania naganishii CBS 8797]